MFIYLSGNRPGDLGTEIRRLYKGAVDKQEGQDGPGFSPEFLRGPWSFGFYFWREENLKNFYVRIMQAFTRAMLLDRSKLREPLKENSCQV